MLLEYLKEFVFWEEKLLQFPHLILFLELDRIKTTAIILQATSFASTNDTKSGTEEKNHNRSPSYSV